MHTGLEDRVWELAAIDPVFWVDRARGGVGLIGNWGDRAQSTGLTGTTGFPS